MVVFEPSREQLPIKMCRARETLRAWEIPREDASLRKKVHEMFDLGLIVGYCAYRDMVQILQSDLGLSYLFSLEKNINDSL